MGNSNMPPLSGGGGGKRERDGRESAQGFANKKSSGGVADKSGIPASRPVCLWLKTLHVLSRRAPRERGEIKLGIRCRAARTPRFRALPQQTQDFLHLIEPR
jgi:hypothetical protein